MVPLKDSNVAQPWQQNGVIDNWLPTTYINVELYETIYTSKITLSVIKADKGQGQNFVLTEFEAGEMTFRFSGILYA